MEVGLMKLVNQNERHPNILRLHEWFDTPDHYIMVLERPDPCVDLLEFCESQNGLLDEQRARAVTEQLLQALLHCQRCGVFHRDVKPPNVLINTETLRVILIDFGCGDLWLDTPYTTFAGTKEVTPPEWFVKGLYQAGPATVWSLGVTLYCLVCGYLPFKGYDERSMSALHFPEGLSPEVMDFISWCLEPKVEARATLGELQVHHWLSPICPEQEHVEEHVEDAYMIGSQIGEGGCGSVLAGFRIDDGQRVALKYVKRWEGDELLMPGMEDGTPGEVVLMTLVDQGNGHPNVLHFYEWFDKADHYVMVLERPENCMDLLDLCASQNGFLDERRARAVTDQLLQALLHCQQCGVFHRDVKPGNVLIDTETQRVILIDFGCGDLWQDTPYTTFAGTKEFAPPEWFMKGLYQAGPATVWSLGVTLYCLVCGYLPFNRYDERSMSVLHFPEGLSPEVMDFISWCLEPKVEDRATLGELQEHDWLSPICPEQVGIVEEEERDCQEDEELKDLQEEKLGSSISLSPRVIMESERECQEDGEEKSMHESKLDLCNSLIPAVMKRECQEDGEEKSMHMEILGCSNSPIPAKCPKNAPGMWKRKMACEQQAVVLGDILLPCSSAKPAKRPRKVGIVEEEERDCQEDEELKDLQEEKLGSSISLSPRVIMESERECQEDGEEKSMHESKLDLCNSLIPAVMKRECQEDGEEKSMPTEILGCSNFPIPAKCSKNAPGMWKRKMACEQQAVVLGDILLPCSSAKPAKRPRKVGIVEEEERDCQEDEELKDLQEEKLGSSISLSPRVIMESERECQEDGEEKSMHESKLDLCNSLIPAVMKRECQEDGEEKSMPTEILGCSNSPIPAKCSKNAPGMRKRKMACEQQAVVLGDILLPCSSAKPAKRPRKDEDGRRLQQQLQPLMLRCGGGESQGSEGEGLKERGLPVPGDRAPPDHGRLRRGAEWPPPQPEQREDEECPGQAQQGLFSPLWPCHSCHCTGPESRCLPACQPQKHRELGYRGHGARPIPGYDQCDGQPGLAVALQDHGPNLPTGLIK
ncbi:uncharacterized protein LOC118206858 [Anguilla anguilla]|uniref:uncharacterized protein LOC118206858 n=1 Tax=Anguilla anguilla TaxID=7936 RepID=UPI0015B2D63F|nr:uncharacterized protein LOC118206858 [Anguilla anguilla]